MKSKRQFQRLGKSCSSHRRLLMQHYLIVHADGRFTTLYLSTRSKLRQLTGFSLTAFRATLRGITGISLSGILSNTIKSILDIFRPGMRWVIQPLLILYYVPILFVRYYFIGPSEQYVNDSRRGHEKLVDGWRKAVEIAERAHADGYWPVHLNGEILLLLKCKK